MKLLQYLKGLRQSLNNTQADKKPIDMPHWCGRYERFKKPDDFSSKKASKPLPVLNEKNK